jgi:hypothetical protein
MPQVVNLKYQPGDVYIGRGSKFGNPYQIPWDGTRQQVINLYRMYLDDCIRRGVITLEELRSLKGKTLGCFCAPQPCHGDVLVEIINGL